MGWHKTADEFLPGEPCQSRSAISSSLQRRIPSRNSACHPRILRWVLRDISFNLSQTPSAFAIQHLGFRVLFPHERPQRSTRMFKSQGVGWFSSTKFQVPVGSKEADGMLMTGCNWQTFGGRELHRKKTVMYTYKKHIFHQCTHGN